MIDILSLTGNRITVVASSDDYIDNVKARIQSLWGISPDQQQLIFGGRVLLDGKTLAFYGIATGATLRLFLKLRGSPTPTPEPLADDRELSDTGQGQAQTGILLGGALLLTAIGATVIARRRMSR
jgi:ubiquitin-like protein Nedd8